MKEKSLGLFPMGFLNVELFVVDDESGGFFDLSPSDKSHPKIMVSIGFENWWQIVNLLIHEALEFSYTLAGVRYSPTGCVDTDSQDLMFIFDHSRYSRCVSDAAMFVSATLDAVEVAWRKAHK